MLRDVRAADIPIFFEQQRDPEANHMAAFAAADPNDRDAFIAHWKRIIADERIVKKTIEVDAAIAGHILSFVQFGKQSVGYWLGREFWGRGIATAALREFLPLIDVRPVYARVAQDNAGSLRVLQKCGFVVCGEDRGFSNSRAIDVAEFLLVLSAPTDADG